MNFFQCIIKAWTACAISLLVACGGSGGGSLANNGGGIGGSGVTVSGTVDGFGSIFVNGIEFETDNASVIIDSSSASELDLRLGMIVVVVGTVDSNGTTGTAISVEFDDEVQGPISSIVVNADGTEKTLVVLGIPVLADQVATTFDDTTFDTLALNDVIEVSGFFDSSLILHATRIEKKETFVAGVSEIEIKGQVTGLSGTQFNLGAFSVDFSAADLSDVAAGTLVEGQSVEVKGTLLGTFITAIRIEDEDELFGDNEPNVSLEGLVSSFVSSSNFTVAGQSINASGAEFHPANLQLENGVRVEVDGVITNGVLIAHEVEARSGEVTLAAPVQSIDITNGNGTITLSYALGSVEFSIDAQTELGDETDSFDPIVWADLRAGDFLEVKGLLNGNQIVATEVRLENSNDQIMQGPTDAFVVGSEVTVFGVPFITTGASFEDSNDLPIDSATFFTQLNQGDLVKIQDDFPANGNANEVEFED